MPGVASIAINLASAYTLVKWTGMGHAGLALSTSMVAVFGALALFVALRERLQGIHGRKLAASAAKIAAAAAIMGVACRASSLGIHAALGAGKPAQLADVALSIPLGIAVFYAAARAFGVGGTGGRKSRVLHFDKECSPT